MIGKSIFSFTFCLLFLSQSQAQPFLIGRTTITFNDPTRTGGFGSGGGPGRQIQTEIYYPAAEVGVNVPVASGNFPLIVFGHGFAMAWSAYANIWEVFVPQGYIVAFPRTETGIFPPPNHLNFGLDIALVGERLQALNTSPASLFFNKVAPKTAFIGHSMGGGAAVLAAKNSTIATTYVGLAPAETNPSAVAAAADVGISSLIFSGDADGVTPPAVHHIPIFNAINADCKAIININGGAHCYFANANFNCDLGESTTPGNITISRTTQQQIMNTYLGFWMAYFLKGEPDAFALLEDSAETDARINWTPLCTLTPNNAPRECIRHFSVFYNTEKRKLVFQNKSKQATTELMLWSVDGRKILNIQLPAHTDEIQIPSIKSGCYFLTAQLSDGRWYKTTIMLD